MRRMWLIGVAVLVLCGALVGSASRAGAITDGQKTAIVDNCEAIRDNLKTVQRNDARARVYLGGYYETILTKYIMTLNVRLVENNLSGAAWVENQNKFAEARGKFVEDFISYQKDLEELVGMDCKKEPVKFYDELEKVRRKRATVAADTERIEKLANEQVKLVEALRGKV